MDITEKHFLKFTWPAWLIFIQPNSNQVRCSPVLTQITKLTYSSSWKKTFPTDGFMVQLTNPLMDTSLMKCEDASEKFLKSWEANWIHRIKQPSVQKASKPIFRNKDFQFMNCETTTNCRFWCKNRYGWFFFICNEGSSSIKYSNNCLNDCTWHAENIF